MGEDLDKLDAQVPEPVREVCRVLSDRGFEAYTVGGGVRDALLGLPAGDWDVTTSAHPDEVQRVFRRTIPTGIKHGTLTVLIGDEHRPMHVEVTTFRGEGAYSDSRRPDTVVFGVPLRADLARRDFVINAMAYDPIARRLEDPFGGARDLAQRTIRAVGDPAERFREDGLRVMRAVRFVAVLGFDLDDDTLRAIPESLDSLAKVSNERVRAELYKLLATLSPRIALEIASDTGVLEVILPETMSLDINSALSRVEAATVDPVIRLGALFADHGDPDAVGRAMRRLTLSNGDRERVVRMVRFGREPADPTLPDGELRRLLAAVTRDGADDVVAVWAAQETDEREVLCRRARIILTRGDALAIGELALTGKDVMRLTGEPPGRRIGEILEHLLDRVLDDPSQNHPDRLAGLLESGTTE